MRLIRKSYLLPVLVSLGLLSAPAAATDPALPNDQCRDQLPLPGCWTTQDVIDGRIDHHAQSAMLRMFTRGGSQAADASAILCAVKRGQLAGVYLPDQQVPALRAKAFGGWWTIIPQGAPSTCYKRPPDQAPLIAFRKQIKDNADFVAQALTTAWRECAIPPTKPRCYTATISKPKPVPPPPPPPPPGPKEEKPCPPGTVPDPSGELCVLPGSVKTECTDAEMAAEFKKQQDFCAGIRMGIDTACQLGASPCDINSPVKFACNLIEQISGKPLPGTKHPACSEPLPTFYEKCVVSTIVGEKDNMRCFPGTAEQIRQRYRSWPDRVK